MKVLFALLVLAALALGIYWSLQKRPEPAPLTPADELARTAERVKDSIQDQLEHFSLRSDNIKDELARTGKVVREKMREAGAALADATKDARTTAAIKAKLIADDNLSALSISVNTTAGIVTLSGFVESHDHIAKAMLLALETDGVREVISTLQVRPVKKG